MHRRCTLSSALPAGARGALATLCRQIGRKPIGASRPSRVVTRPARGEASATELAAESRLSETDIPSHALDLDCDLSCVPVSAFSLERIFLRLSCAYRPQELFHAWDPCSSSLRRRQGSALIAPAHTPMRGCVSTGSRRLDASAARSAWRLRSWVCCALRCRLRLSWGEIDVVCLRLRKLRLARLEAKEEGCEGAQCLLASGCPASSIKRAFLCGSSHLKFSR